MKYSERQEFKYDPQLGTVRDTGIALRVFDEYVCRFSPRPFPSFFEVDRSPGGTTLDPLYGTPRSARQQFSRTLEIPSINEFPEQKFTVWWNKVRTRGDRFWLSNLGLQKADYFPVQGDMVYWTGYRLTVINVSIPPSAYWGQTGVWTGLIADCVLAPYGDLTPPADLSKIAPAEQAGGRNTPTSHLGASV
jgi:hypothetical protein